MVIWAVSGVLDGGLRWGNDWFGRRFGGCLGGKDLWTEDRVMAIELRHLDV